MTNETDLLRGRRLAAVHHEALGDIEDGYLHVLTNLDEGWQLGLIAADSTRTEDLLLAQQGMEVGVDILRLERCHLLTLYRSRDTGSRQRWVGTTVDCASGNRYFLMVSPVENGDDFYDDED